MEQLYLAMRHWRISDIISNMNNKYKLLILDYGGVYSFEYNLAAQDTIMQKTFDRVPSRHEYTAIKPLSMQLAANTISSIQYVEEVAAPSHSVFEKETIAVTHDPSPDMISFVKETRSSGLLVSLLSDMYLFEAVKTKPWGRYDGFDYVSLSAEIGEHKGSSKVFMNTLKHFGLPAESVLFVDDKKSNIDTAQSIGMNCIWANHEVYSSAADLIREIRKQL